MGRPAQLWPMAGSAQLKGQQHGSIFQMSLKVGESERAMANLPYFLLGRTRRGWRGVRGAPKLAGGTYGVCLPLAMAIILGDHHYCWDGSHMPFQGTLI